MKRSLRTKLSSFSPEVVARIEPLGFDRNRARRALPPLQTLVAFEAAARLQSFTLAASELNLTQPAISQQVKLLEERLRVALFKRRNNQIILTEQGEHFAESVCEFLDGLAESVQDLALETGRTTLTVSLLPSFAATWFASRSHRFAQDNPSIDLIALSTIARTGFGQEETDIAIRWGPGGAEDLYEEFLFGENHLLVASADIAEAVKDISHVDDLSTFPTFFDTSFSLWRDVIKKNGGTPEKFETGCFFGDSSATLNAIVFGRGVGVVRDVIAQHLLDRGDLVESPFASVAGQFSYFFVRPQGRVGQPRVQAMLNWLREESKAHK